MHMNSLAQHASQVLKMEGDHRVPARLLHQLPPLFPPQQQQQPQQQHGGLYLPHLTLDVPSSGVPTAQQLYMALLDIQMAAASAAAAAGVAPPASHRSNINNSSTTTTTTTTTSAILLPGLLSSQLAAQLAQQATSSPARSCAKSAVKRNVSKGGCGHRSGKHTPSPGVATPSPPSSKRGKKTSGRVCAECRTDNTLQWRLGPDGQASLCNACGQRFQRRKQAMANSQGQSQQPRTGDSSSCSSSPASSPPVASPQPYFRVKSEPVASPPAPERRSDIYSLLN